MLNSSPLLAPLRRRPIDPAGLPRQRGTPPPSLSAVKRDAVTTATLKALSAETPSPARSHSAGRARSEASCTATSASACSTAYRRMHQPPTRGDWLAMCEICFPTNRSEVAPVSIPPVHGRALVDLARLKRQVLARGMELDVLRDDAPSPAGRRRSVTPEPASGTDPAVDSASAAEPSVSCQHDPADVTATSASHEPEAPAATRHVTVASWPGWLEGVEARYRALLAAPIAPSIQQLETILRARPPRVSSPRSALVLLRSGVGARVLQGELRTDAALTGKEADSIMRAKRTAVDAAVTEYEHLCAAYVPESTAAVDAILDCGSPAFLVKSTTGSAVSSAVGGGASVRLLRAQEQHRRIAAAQDARAARMEHLNDIREERQDRSRAAIEDTRALKEYMQRQRNELRDAAIRDHEAALEQQQRARELTHVATEQACSANVAQTRAARVAAARAKAEARAKRMEDARRRQDELTQASLQRAATKEAVAEMISEAQARKRDEARQVAAARAAVSEDRRTQVKLQADDRLAAQRERFEERTRAVQDRVDAAHAVQAEMARALLVAQEYRALQRQDKADAVGERLRTTAALQQERLDAATARAAAVHQQLTDARARRSEANAKRNEERRLLREELEQRQAFGDIALAGSINSRIQRSRDVIALENERSRQAALKKREDDLAIRELAKLS